MSTWAGWETVGSGSSYGIDWQLVHHALLGVGIRTSNGISGGSYHDRTDGLGGFGSSRYGEGQSGCVIFCGEVHPRYTHVVLELEDGSAVRAEMFPAPQGRSTDLYVAAVRVRPTLIKATNDDGDETTIDATRPTERTQFPE